MQLCQTKKPRIRLLVRKTMFTILIDHFTSMSYLCSAIFFYKARPRNYVTFCITPIQNYDFYTIFYVNVHEIYLRI